MVLIIGQASRAGLFCANGIRRWQVQSLCSCSGDVPSIDRVRVRFAPSPTGELHVGGLRTALYNFLFARKSGGDFILRCEDTDQTRFVPEALERMLSLLDWFGITPDEGPHIGGPYGPYMQSERRDLYRKWAEYLIQQGHAYKCFCSPHRLELLRKDQVRRREVIQGYDNLCRNLTEEQVQDNMNRQLPYVIRFKLSSSAQSFTDLVFGEIANETGSVEGDPILLKSDGLPTYHLANVVDDHHMKISHVLRGMEWQASTPKHLQLFSAFGWTPPQYAHLPLLMNPDGTKLSKRQNHIQVSTIKEEGYESESLLALLCLTGGGVRILNKDITHWGVTLSKAIKNFGLEYIRTQNSVLELERLDQLNRTCIQSLAVPIPGDDRPPAFKSTLKQLAQTHLATGAIHIQASSLDSKLDQICKHILAHSDRLSKLNDLFRGDFAFLWMDLDKISLSKLSELKISPGLTRLLLEYLLDLLRNPGSLTNGEILTELQANTIDFKQKKSAFYKILRVVLTGEEVGPPVIMLFDLLTLTELEQRCARACHWMASELDVS